MEIENMHIQARLIILNVIKFCEEEKQCGFQAPHHESVKRVCLATGLSQDTVMRIKNEAKRNEDDLERTKLGSETGSAISDVIIKIEPSEENIKDSERTKLGSETDSLINDVNVKTEPSEENIEVSPHRMMSVEIQCEPEFDLSEMYEHNEEEQEEETQSNQPEDNPKRRKRTKPNPEKQHPCTFCNKTFNKMSNLKVHLRLHTGEKPFECDICQSRFTVNVSLQKHLKTHMGKKPFKCNICGTFFVVKSDLFEHLWTHTGGKA